MVAPLGDIDVGERRGRSPGLSGLAERVQTLMDPRLLMVLGERLLVGRAVPPKSCSPVSTDALSASSSINSSGRLSRAPPVPKHPGSGAAERVGERVGRRPPASEST